MQNTHAPPSPHPHPRTIDARRRAGLCCEVQKHRAPPAAISRHFKTGLDMSDALGTYAKIWRAHLVHTDDAGASLVYIDRHILHTDTSAQAFDGLRLAQRGARRAEACFAPYADAPAGNPVQAKLLDTLDANAHEYHLARFENGELAEGILQPGMTVCGQRADIGMFGGIGAVCFFADAAACEHALATQTLRLSAPPVMYIEMDADMAAHSAESLLAQLVQQTGLPALRTHALEMGGSGIAAMDIDARLRLAALLSGITPFGALIAPDEKTIDWLKGKSHAPSGRDWAFACEYWEDLRADENAPYDARVTLGSTAARSA